MRKLKQGKRKMSESRITQILKKIDSLDNVEHLDVYEITYLSNYLENVQIDLFLKGKISKCPIESQFEIDKEFAQNMFKTYGSFDWE